MSNRIGDAVQLLREIPLFSQLAPDELSALAEVTVPRELPRRALVFDEGDPGDAVFLIKSGVVRIYRLDREGREQTLAFLEAGAWFGEMAIFDGLPRSAAAECLTPVKLLAIAREDFIRVVRAHPDIAIHLLEAMSLRLRRINEQVERVAFWDARARIAAALLDLARDHGKAAPGGIALTLRLTHRELAGYAGTSRETVSRVLGDLYDDGIIEVGAGGIVIRSPEKLAEEAENESW